MLRSCKRGKVFASCGAAVVLLGLALVRAARCFSPFLPLIFGYSLPFNFSLGLFSSRNPRSPSAESSSRTHCS